MSNEHPEPKKEEINTPLPEKTTMAARLMAFLNNIRVLDKSDEYFYAPLEILTQDKNGGQECTAADWEMLLRSDKNLYLTAMNSVAKLPLSYAAAINAKNKRDKQAERQAKRQEEKEQRQEEREQRRARRAEIDARIALQNDPVAMKKHRMEKYRAERQARADHLRKSIPLREKAIAENATLRVELQNPGDQITLDYFRKELADIEAELATLGEE